MRTTFTAYPASLILRRTRNTFSQFTLHTRLAMHFYKYLIFSKTSNISLNFYLFIFFLLLNFFIFIFVQLLKTVRCTHGWRAKRRKKKVISFRLFYTFSRRWSFSSQLVSYLLLLPLMRSVLSRCVSRLVRCKRVTFCMCCVAFAGCANMRWLTADCPTS